MDFFSFNPMLIDRSLSPHWQLNRIELIPLPTKINAPLFIVSSDTIIEGHCSDKWCRFGRELFMVVIMSVCLRGVDGGW